MDESDNKDVSNMKELLSLSIEKMEHLQGILAIQ